MIRALCPRLFAPAALWSCLLLSLPAALTGCGSKGQETFRPVPVEVARASVRPVPLSLSAVGTVEPIETVAVRAQVGGVITNVGFTEGRDVKAGQLLFQIDARPYRAALSAAEAQLAKDAAQATNAEIQAKRYAELVKDEYVAQEQYDQARTQAAMYKSAVDADTAAVEQAKLNLAYASVATPISGRAGSLLVKRGNVVKANDVPLVIINQLHPIRVSFAIPGAELPLVQRHLAQGQLQVQVRPMRDTAAAAQEGKLSFVDNNVDPATGTVTLKAELPNEGDTLWPGQFVDVSLVLTVEPNALTVPAAALVTGQNDTFVYVVGSDNKVEKRTVQVNRTVNGTAVLDQGLAAGELVVTDGQLRLVPGATVEIKTGTAAAAGEGKPS